VSKVTCCLNDSGLVFAAHETTRWVLYSVTGWLFNLLTEFSGALARLLHRLAMDPKRQDRLREEIQEAHTRFGETLDYNEIHSLPYLDALCKESLRVDPPVPVLRRISRQDCILPLRYPTKGRNGETIQEVYIEKGTGIYVALREANRCK
jgi:cytochrome P450